MTPGPWKADRFKVIAGPFIITQRWNGTAKHEALEGNARAIASLPDLVAELQECREFFRERADAELDESGYTGNDEMRRQVAIEQVLRKAGIE